MDADGGILAVVVAYRSTAAIAGCVASLLANGAAVVVVVDNSADPATARALVDLGPQVRYLATDENLGFGRAANLGVSAGPPDGGDWVAVVNPDVRLHAHLGLLTAAARRTGAAVVGGGLRVEGVVEISNARPPVRCRTELARALVGGRVNHVDVVPGTGLRWVGSVDGALLVVRRRHWVALGGFDPRFELYFEDADLCARSGPLGGVLMVDQVVGDHLGGASYVTNRGPAYRAYRYSRLLYLDKHFGRRGRVVAVTCALIELVTRTLARCPEGDRVRVRSTLDQLRAGLGGRGRRVLG